MKKLFIPAIFILIFSFSAFAQEEEQRQQTADEIQRVQLVGALERAQAEVKASRKYIDALKSQVEIKQSEIAALNEKDALSAKAIASLQSETANLRAAITEATAALETQKREVAELKKDLDRTRRKLHRARALTKYLAIAAAALGAALVLK